MDRFCYNLNSNLTIAEEDPEFHGDLEIFVHHARNIHNICIYDDQDVYAKFSLTRDPDHALSTKVVNGGGKNPNFNEGFTMAISHLEAVLKCEIWMRSRARSFMEDQLLGFTLVPLAQLAAKPAKTTRDYSLSSTDLFHSPVGTVLLTLSLDASRLSGSPATSSITSEVEFLGRKGGEVVADYARIEFPDIGVATENQRMATEYFDMAEPGAAFLCLGAPVSDCEMAGGSSEESSAGIGCGPDTPTSKKGAGAGEIKVPFFARNEEEGRAGCSGEFPGAVGGADMEEEQSAMQKQIVEMYTRSMQQFTESLAKMKLPMELENAESRPGNGAGDGPEGEKKDGARVFYGSRAFF